MKARSSFVLLWALLPSAPALAQTGEPVATLVVDGLGFQHLFGDSVALSNDALAVSAPAVQRGAGGAVCFYRRGGRGWRLEDVLLADKCFPEGQTHPHCQFGFDLSLLGDRALIGSAAGDFWQGSTGGAAFVVEQEAGQWKVRQAIRSPQVPGVSFFGFGLVVTQNTRTLAISGAKYPVSKSVQGAVFLYEKAPGGGPWALVQTLFAPPQGAFGAGVFGFSSAMTEDLLVIGEPAPYGRVHVFQNQGGAWGLKASLYKPGTANEDDYFGYAVAIDPETRTIVVGDPQETHPFGGIHPGQAHVFEYDEVSDNWTWTALLHPAGPHVDSYSNDRFGTQISAHGGRVLIGGPREKYKNVMHGSAELFQKIQGTWQQVRRYALENPSGAPGGGLGSAVAVEGGTAVVGASSWTIDVYGTGAAFVYEESLGRVFCEATDNSSGVPADLAVLGSAAAADQNLTLAVHHAPVGGYGMLAVGERSAGTRLGAGALCLKRPYHFVSGLTGIGPSGSAYISLDFRDPALIGLLVPGSTRTFQFLYRDPDAHPRGATNTTNACSLTLQ